MKTLILIATLMISTVLQAGVIDLREGFNGKGSRYYLQTLSSGERVTVNLGRGTYVETVKIAAIGKQRRYSFGKVYADGEEIATLGVPGRDPEYPIVVRDRVSVLEVVATDGSRFKIDDFKIFTGQKQYTSYLNRRPHALSNYGLDGWGVEVLDIVSELNHLYGVNRGPAKDIFLNLKRAAMRTQASDIIRNPKSLKTFRYARVLLERIIDAEDYLLTGDFFLLDSTADMIITDLMTVKEDISEQYDLDL